MSDDHDADEQEPAGTEPSEADDDAPGPDVHTDPVVFEADLSDESSPADDTSVPNRTAVLVWMAGIAAAVIAAAVLILVFTGDNDTSDDGSGASAEPSAAPEPSADTADTEPTISEAEASEPIDIAVSRGGEATEKPNKFYNRLAKSLSSGDLEFALSRLDPAMDELYGDACESSLARLSEPTFDITFYRVKRTEPWLFESPRGSVDIDESVVTVIALHGSDQSGDRAESHLTVVDGKYHWFTYC